MRDRSGLLPKSLTWKTEAAIRKGLQASRFTEADGKCPEILDIHPISALQQCRKSSHYLQSTEENRFLKSTPTPPTVLRRQRLCSPDLPQIHHSPISFLQSGMESSNLTSSRQGLRHPPHSAFTAILESAWQRPRCSSGPLFLRRHRRKPAHRIVCPTLLS